MLYAQQDRLGLKTFHQFAVEAGVRDLAAFDRCAALEDPIARIDADVAEVTRLGGTGTPTVLMNGLLLRGGVSAPLLDSLARQALRQDATR